MNNYKIIILWTTTRGFGRRMRISWRFKRDSGGRRFDGGRWKSIYPSKFCSDGGKADINIGSCGGGGFQIRAEMVLMRELFSLGDRHNSVGVEVSFRPYQKECDVLARAIALHWLEMFMHFFEGLAVCEVKSNDNCMRIPEETWRQHPEPFLSHCVNQSENIWDIVYGHFFFLSFKILSSISWTFMRKCSILLWFFFFFFFFFFFLIFLFLFF